MDWTMNGLEGGDKIKSTYCVSQRKQAVKNTDKTKRFKQSSLIYVPICHIVCLSAEKTGMIFIN